MRDLTSFEVGLLIGRLGLMDEDVENILNGTKVPTVVWNWDVESDESRESKPTLLADKEEEGESFSTTVELPDEAVTLIPSEDVPSKSESEIEEELDKLFPTDTSDGPTIIPNEDAAIVTPEVVPMENAKAEWGKVLNKDHFSDNKSQVVTPQTVGDNPWISNKWETLK